MKALFADIRDGRIEEVRRRLDAQPSLVSSVAKAPPKKDDGQSPLQVAVKTGRLRIAELLLDRGADVNYIEASSVNEWRAPVIHDVLRAAVKRSRWLVSTTFGDDDPEWAMKNSAEAADRWYGFLVRVVDEGADVHALDSYGNSCLQRVILDAREVLPRVRFDDPTWVDPQPWNDELVSDLTRIFGLLYAHGVDPDEERDAHSGKSLAETYRDDSVGRFLNKRGTVAADG